MGEHVLYVRLLFSSLKFPAPFLFGLDPSDQPKPMVKSFWVSKLNLASEKTAVMFTGATSNCFYLCFQKD